MHKRSRKDLCACPLTSPPSCIRLPPAPDSCFLLLIPLQQPQISPTFIYLFILENDSSIKRHPPLPSASSRPDLVASKRARSPLSDRGIALWSKTRFMTSFPLISLFSLAHRYTLVAIDHSPWAAGARVACRYLQSAPLPGSPASDPGRG